MTTYAPNMILIRGGSFIMGAHDHLLGDAWVNEFPARRVFLDSFKMSETLVTISHYQEYYAACGKSLPDTDVGDPQLPITKVDYSEAVEYCGWLSQYTGENFAIPTEAQWEYAAKGGQLSCSYCYSGSNNIDEIGWYNSNSNLRLNQAGLLKPNELGLFDLSGNTYEWCSDWYEKYDSKDLINPIGPSYSALKVIRGGSFRSIDKACRVSSRYYAYPELKSKGIGIRLVINQVD